MRCISDIFNGPENFILFVSTCLIILLILAGAFLGRKKLGVISEGWSAVLELIYDLVDDMSVSFMGERGRRYTPFAVSVFLFILICNWSGLLPVPSLHGTVNPHAHYHIFEAPTASYNTTLALAVISVFAFTFYGIKQKVCGDPKEEAVSAESEQHIQEGKGLFGGFIAWLGHYLGLVPSLSKQLEGVMRIVMIPLLGVLFCFLNVIEEAARLLSLSFRLYGNIYGEHMVKSKLLETAWTFLKGGFAEGAGIGSLVMGIVIAAAMWAISFFVTCLGALAGFIQALVFCMLTLSYISHVVSDEH